MNHWKDHCRSRVRSLKFLHSVVDVFKEIGILILVFGILDFVYLSAVEKKEYRPFALALLLLGVVLVVFALIQEYAVLTLDMKLEKACEEQEAAAKTKSESKG